MLDICIILCLNSQCILVVLYVKNYGMMTKTHACTEYTNTNKNPKKLTSLKPKEVKVEETVCILSLILLQKKKKYR